MGTATWDKRNGADALMQYSTVSFHGAKDYMVLHRALKIAPEQVKTLAVALTSDAAFRATVPDFLLQWKDVKGTSGSRRGLDQLAKLIQTGKLSGTSAWQFAVTPVPADKGKNLGRVFDITLRLHFKQIIKKAKDRKIAIAGLQRR